MTQALNRSRWRDEELLKLKLKQSQSQVRQLQAQKAWRTATLMSQVEALEGRDNCCRTVWGNHKRSLHVPVSACWAIKSAEHSTLGVARGRGSNADVIKQLKEK